MLATDLLIRISKTLTSTLRYGFHGMNPPPSNGWYPLSKLLEIKPIRKFPREAVLETIRADSYRFALVGDLVGVTPSGTTGHRRIDAAIPELTPIPRRPMPSNTEGATSTDDRFRSQSSFHASRDAESLSKGVDHRDANASDNVESYPTDA